MKDYRILGILLIVVILTTACIEGQKENAGSLSSSENALAIDSGKVIPSTNENIDQEKSIPTLQYFYTIDPANGMAMSRIPFPATWEQHKDGEFAFTGPNGIKVYGESARYYSYSNDPMTMAMYQNAGINVKSPLDMEQSINEFLIPNANKVNRKLVKKYPIPSLLEGHKNFVEMLYRKEQGQKQYNSTAIEWVDPDGTQWITVLHYNIEQVQQGVLWGFTASAIGAPSEYFQQAKQDFLNGMLNKQMNPQWISAVNRKSQASIESIEEADRIRTAQWQRMMAERKQQWDTYQENYKNRQAQTARQNELVSDAILGKVNIIDPDSRQSTKIDNTNTHYWVNSQNEYIGTNKSYEDPNKNAFLNGETWREFKIDDYKQ